MVCALIKMGGKGVRFGEQYPKQFYQIGGIPLFAHVLEKYNRVEVVDKYIIVSNSEWMDITYEYSGRILGDKLLEITSGGTTNARSTYNGVMCAAKYLNRDDILLVHDITDPIIDERAIREVIRAGQEYKCAAIVTEQVHTLYRKNEEGYITGTIDRQTVGSGYSPEAFRFEVVYACYENATEQELENMTSAMALVQAHHINPKAVISHQADLKITYQEDMEALKLMIANGEQLYQERTGRDA